MEHVLLGIPDLGQCYWVFQSDPQCPKLILVPRILAKFSDEESYAYEMITPEITYLVKENILFVDSVRGIIKPQSRLNLLAIRKVMKDA